MARIFGIEIPNEKRIEASLQYMYGIGSTTAGRILEQSGIDPDIRPRLFDAFNTSKPNGLGLGLSICRTIIEAHGGRIDADARPGGGTTLWFTIPSAETQE